jgi:NlpC/P60 family putative phage cell wall peptidase
MAQVITAEQQERNAVIASARTWLTTPFVHGAGVKGAGCDCAHLLTAVYADVHKMPAGFTYPEYRPDWWRHTKNPEQFVIETAKKYFTEIAAAEALPGDFVVLYMEAAWCHCAIMSGKDRAIEAWPKRATVAEINTKEEQFYRNHAKRFFTCWPKKTT